MLFDCRHEEGIGKLELIETSGGNAEIRCCGRMVAGKRPAVLSDTCRHCRHCSGFRGYRRTMLVRGK